MHSLDTPAASPHRSVDEARRGRRALRSDRTRCVYEAESRVSADRRDHESDRDVVARCQDPCVYGILIHPQGLKRPPLTRLALVAAVLIVLAGAWLPGSGRAQEPVPISVAAPLSSDELRELT